MNWVISLLVALLSGATSLFLAGVIANACVSWYQVTSREGASGFFVVSMALLGGIVGTIVGLFIARLTASYTEPGFLKELAASLGVISIIACMTTLLCRLYADVPPTIEGRELMLQVEFRFPDTVETEAEPTSSGNWRFTLASLAGFESRRSEEGKILHSAARFEDQRWIVPAEVELFTERGKRCVTLAKTDAAEVTSFLLPVPRHPGKDHEQWSQWLPLQQADGSPWPANKASCRFRVKKVPIETELLDAKLDDHAK